MQAETHGVYKGLGCGVGLGIFYHIKRARQYPPFGYGVLEEKSFLLGSTAKETQLVERGITFWWLGFLLKLPNTKKSAHLFYVSHIITVLLILETLHDHLEGNPRPFFQLDTATHSVTAGEELS